MKRRKGAIGAIILTSILVITALTVMPFSVFARGGMGGGGGGMGGGGGGMGGGGMGGLTQEQMLGKMLYMDTSLSMPAGQSCWTCHSPMAGFADPNSAYPVSKGAVAGRFGNRNSPSAAYAAYSPVFHYDAAKGNYVGGQFWDGRADSLADQAMGPPLNPLEMNAPDKAYVVNKIKSGMQATMFRSVYGATSLDNVDAAYRYFATAIASWEASSQVNRFDSRFDSYKAGQVTLTAQEARGLALFNGKGKCSTCHPSAVTQTGVPALFTDFSYHNLGIPKNWSSPFLGLPPEFNPAGTAYVDYGLGGRLGDAGQNGKFKAPTLRNIAKTAPYGHNGYFLTLQSLVHFKNTRDSAAWSVPEVPANKTAVIGNLKLTTQEEADIVAFLKTLSDTCGCM